jgi:hypothetical protein
MGKHEGVRVYEGEYRGWTSAVIENDSIRVETVPALGGKLVSLLHKPNGKEWLLDSGSRPLKQPVYGSTFTDWDMSGWDECFPTIDACTIDGVELPDHGEVWPLAWSCETGDDWIRGSVQTEAMPYRLTRTISITGSNRVRLTYQADNLGGKALPFLWAAHPQFAVSEPTRILLPEQVTEMLCVNGGLELETGDTYFRNSFVQLSPALTGDGKKFYYPGEVNFDWSGLYGEDSRSYLVIHAPRRDTPHFGIWMDEGAYNDRSAVALEPGIGYYDSLERAAANGTAGQVEAGGSREWHLELELGQGDQPLGI